MSEGFNNANGGILRAERGEMNPYTIVSNIIVRDKRLGYLAKGIMLELLSNNDSWVVVKSELFKKAQVGRKYFNEAWDSLEKYGYIHKDRIRSGWRYTIVENPVMIGLPTYDTGVTCTDVI